MKRKDGYVYPGPEVPMEYLSLEEIAHCNGAPRLLSHEERRQQISILASRQATHLAKPSPVAHARPQSDHFVK